MSGHYFSEDTIAAVATSLAGDGGVGIIRVSGPAALACAQAVSQGLERPEPRYLHRVLILEDGAPVDDGLGVYFPQGQSFTGEDVVELQLHGGRFLLQAVLQLLIKTGKARLALPGEFSFRAVRNGKLSLSGAEAVSQIIGARSMFEVRAARRSLSENRNRDFHEVADRIRNLLAQSELSIDFIDQDVEVISPAALRAELDALRGRVRELLERMQAAQRIAKGIQLTLVGVPNAGKSTLFNALLAEDRAIVSPEAGTTRDVITEELRIGPYYVRLADTAGLRRATGSIESEGIAKARELASESDVVVMVVDATEPLERLKDQAAKVDGRSAASILALNKVDLLEAAETEKRLRELGSVAGCPVVTLSASSGQGLDALLSAVRRAMDERYGIGMGGLLPTEFQLQMLLETGRCLDQVVELVDASGLTHPELVSAGLGSAARALSDLVGETTPDTVLAKIFSEFCIGK